MPSRTRLAAVGATAVAALPASAIASTCVVHPGDTIGDIALRHGTTVRALAEANHLADPNLLRVGQLLHIPDARAGLPRYTAGADDTETYTTTAGDTLISVARRHGVDLTALARTNGLNVNAPLAATTALNVPGRIARGGALIASVAEDVGVSPALVRAVAWMESRWTQSLVSPTGAVGIMQIEPFSGEWVSKYLAGRRLEIHVAAENVLAGTLLLRHLLAVHDDSVDAALAAYYQGDASIARHGVYADTVRYQQEVAALLAQD
ncbi:MAG: LysM peptidoglycan-binding domain-containing protein [Candidatus Dormibacteria bacterium]